jgi:dTDP-4-amino-4,6-dideoxygalactose transaminase
MSFNVLFDFEKALADYTGAPYVVVTDGCTHAIELAMRCYQVNKVEFTAYTYLSIVMTMGELGVEYNLTDEQWTGEYQFHGTNIWDSARRLEPNMYRSGQVQCLSFGNTKPLELGKGGAILLDDPDVYYLLSCMRSDGRNLHIAPWQTQSVFKQGYHYCPTLELCKQGIERLPQITPQSQTAKYPDCRQITIVH